MILLELIDRDRGSDSTARLPLKRAAFICFGTPPGSIPPPSSAGRASCPSAARGGSSVPLPAFQLTSQIQLPYFSPPPRRSPSSSLPPGYKMSLCEGCRGNSQSRVTEGKWELPVRLRWAVWLDLSADHWYKNEIVISGIITVGIQPINLIQPSSCSPSGQTGGEWLLWLTSHFLVSQLSKVAHEATENGANPLARRIPGSRCVSQRRSISLLT